MEDINLHFTGDFHAIASAHNLLSAMLDAHLHHGNASGLDTRRITWPRTIDINDRALRSVIVGLGGLNAGPAREERFVIIPGSEIMAIMALATGLGDLEQRLARIIVGLTQDKRPVRGSDLKAHGAMTLLLKDAITRTWCRRSKVGPRSSTAGRSATSPTAATRWSRPSWRSRCATWCFRKPALGRTWAPRSSSTSSAAPPA